MAENFGTFADRSKGGKASTGISRPSGLSATGKVYQTERAKLVARLRLEGHTIEDIARDLRLTQRQVIRISNRAVEDGLVEGVREAMQRQLLPKVQRIYTEIMDAPAAELAHKDVQKGHELKLKAARHAADGLGVFRKTPVAVVSETNRIDLQQFYALEERQAAAALPEGEVVEGGMPLDKSPEMASCPDESGHVVTDGELPIVGSILPELGEDDDGLGES